MCIFISDYFVSFETLFFLTSVALSLALMPTLLMLMLASLYCGMRQKNNELK